MRVVTQTNITEYPLLSRGKVRDIYEIDEETLLIVTTDRMSAFDVVMNEPIPHKGVVLNQITLFWMDKTADIVPNHILERDVARFPKKLAPYADMLEGRSVLARKARPLPVECIVRGHIAGSGWKDYVKTGQVCGYTLPKGLRESDRLEKPLFMPSTKAEIGRHDQNISTDEAAALIGRDMEQKLEDASIRIFERAREHARQKGIIVADTKFEFGLVPDDHGETRLTLIDEVLTPDSSRFWSASSVCFLRRKIFPGLNRLFFFLDSSSFAFSTGSPAFMLSSISLNSLWISYSSPMVMSLSSASRTSSVPPLCSDTSAGTDSPVTAFCCSASRCSA